MIDETITWPSWQRVTPAQMDATFLFLARGTRVTFGKYAMDKPKGWCSWDGGFSKKEPPTHWINAPKQDWNELRAWVDKHGLPPALREGEKTEGER
jgi:hypothetical protein